jgi:hypothetical protein
MKREKQGLLKYERSCFFLQRASLSFWRFLELYNETLLHAVQQVADGLINWKQTGADP